MNGKIVLVLAVIRAAIRVRWLEPRSSLPELARRLRATKPDRLRADPTSVLPVVEALLIVMTPRGAGRCLKRSLLLLDLWSRAGLEPSLHLGYQADESGLGLGHAWVTTHRREVGTYCPPGVREAWSG